MPKALALYSGGLDSTLAILAILKQGVEVIAFKFIHPFNESIKRRLFFNSEKIRDKNLNIDINVILIHDQFMDIVKKPKFGYGKNMNPCIDCKILMLKEAKKIMDRMGYDFIITGEVLGQRPMSQRRDILSKIDKEASVKGYVLRPLSAKLLEPTVPELTNIILRERLYDFSGRSRKPQIKLSQEFGIVEYAQPAGGCLLTDPIYSQKLKELLSFNSSSSINDIRLLQVGRHFRVQNAKIIVGRDKIENNLIESLALPQDIILWVKGHNSPLTLIRGEIINDEIIHIAASLCIKYSGAKMLSHVTVLFRRKEDRGQIYHITSKALSDDLVSLYQIIKG